MKPDNPRLACGYESIRRSSVIRPSEIIAALWDLDPRVAVLPGHGEEFFMTPDTLGEGEADIVVEAVEGIVTDTQRQTVAVALGERADL